MATEGRRGNFGEAYLSREGISFSVKNEDLTPYLC